VSAASNAQGAIDCDVHCAPATAAQLAPYLDEYWQDYIANSGIKLMGLPVAYPPGSPTTAVEAARDGDGSGVPSTYEVLKERLLDPRDPRYAILSCLTLFEAHRHPYYATALASAVNDWLRAEWLDRDERLRASIVVPCADPDDAVAEIERVGDDTRFVQVLLPVRNDAPYGNKRYHRLFATAAERNLTIGLHAWGRHVSAPTPNGLASTYLEDYLNNQLIVQTHVLSLVSEGVFERFPDLRVSLLECGFAWLPPLIWRFDKDWKALWREVPWVKEKPSTYVKRHFRATTAPACLPESVGEVRELLEMIGPGWLIYASDYPHNHGPGVDVLFEALDDEESQAVRQANAAAFYRFVA
jgi:predicted TIM-barrel fold metal-dependent hydrolase